MIYFIQDSGSCNIKIGFTSKEDIQERIRDMQTGTPAKLILLASCEGSKDAEQVLHRQFAEYATGDGGEEWFRPAPAIIQLIIAKTAHALAAKAVGQTIDALYKQQQESQRVETTIERPPSESARTDNRPPVPPVSKRQ